MHRQEPLEVYRCGSRKYFELPDVEGELIVGALRRDEQLLHNSLLLSRQCPITFGFFVGAGEGLVHADFVVLAEVLSET